MPQHACKTFYQCQECHGILCWECNAVASSVIVTVRTGVRWCPALACAKAKARAYGVTIEELEAARIRES